MPLVAVLVEQAETVTVLPGAEGLRVPSYNDAATATAALAVAVAAAVVSDRPDDPAPEPANIDRGAAQLVIDACLDTTPRGRTLYASERSALLGAFGVTPAHGGAGSASRNAHRITVTAWQDVVFGPLLTCARDGDSGPQTTLLVPAGAGDLAELARQAADPSRAAEPDGGRETGYRKLIDLLARIAAIVDGFPRIASLCLDVLLTDDGGVRVVSGDAQVAPAQRKDPYRRRLRRAPVE